MPTSDPTWDDTTAVEDVPSWDDTAAVKEKDTTHQIAGREVPFNPAQYVAGGGGMAGISLIPAPGPARDNPLGSYIPETPDIKGESILGQLAAAPVNVGKHLLEGMASPLGVATLGLGPIPRVAQGLIGAGFGVPAAVEGVKRVYRGTALADPQEAIEGALQAITGGLITGGAAHGALTKEIPKIPEPEKPPIIPPPKIVDVQPPQTAPVNLEVPEAPPSVVAAGASPEAPLSIPSVYPPWATPELASAIKRAQHQKPGDFQPFPEWDDASPQQKRLLMASDFDFEKQGDQIMVAPRKSQTSRVSKIKFTDVSPEAPSVSAAEVPVAAGVEPAKAEPNVTPEVTQEGVPPIVGMGGAASGEIPATGEGADIFGVAERVRAERARAGQTPQLEPGEGVSSADAVAYGKTLLEKDPAVADLAAAAFEKDKALTYEGFAAARAKSEDLFAKARQIEEEHGTDSNEYRAAAAEGAKWDKITKDMQTEWHKLGQAQQGQTDLDTGTFTGLEREWIKQTKKPFTPEQAQRARVIAEESSNATEAAIKANVELADKLAKAAFTNPASKKIWDYAKANYIDKGTTDFVDVVNNVSTDLGVSPADVRKAFAEPKSARKTLDEVYEKYANRRRMVNAAKQWIQDEQAPGYSKFLGAIPRIWFLKTIAGHGTALHVTHAPSQAVNPFNAAIWWRSFFQQWPFAYKRGYSEMMIQDAVNDPNYIRARRWGLQNDFFKNTGDYQTTASKLKGMWSILAGTKGTDGLKVLRQRIFSSEWNQLPESLKNEDSGRKIANSVNHMTGALTTRKPGSVMSTIFFAPQLEGSRWVYQYADSYKAGEILANWKKATPEEKYWATREVKQKAAIVGTYLGLLTANQGLLKAMGSGQDINFTDPTKSDWLSFKAAGHKAGFMGPMLGETRLLANMLKTGVEAQRKGPETRSDREKQAVADYARGKLSPFTGNIADATLMQADYSGRPLPWSNDRVPAYLRKRGIGKYTYGEYLSQQLPIPFAEAAREVWEQQGVDKDTADKWFKVLAVGAAATTGVRVGTDYNAKGK